MPAFCEACYEHLIREERFRVEDALGRGRYICKGCNDDNGGTGEKEITKNGRWEKEKTWLGPKPVRCDLCGRSLESVTVFIDGRTRMGPWGILCSSCHKQYGVGLGTGFGQKYRRVKRGNRRSNRTFWVKIAG